MPRRSTLKSNVLLPDNMPWRRWAAWRGCFSAHHWRAISVAARPGSGRVHLTRSLAYTHGMQNLRIEYTNSVSSSTWVAGLPIHSLVALSTVKWYWCCRILSQLVFFFGVLTPFLMNAKNRSPYSLAGTALMVSRAWLSDRQNVSNLFLTEYFVKQSMMPK